MNTNLIRIILVGAAVAYIGVDKILEPITNPGMQTLGGEQSASASEGKSENRGVRALQQIDEDENVAAFSITDKGMESAKAKGRATLPRFYELMTSRTAGDYLVKFPLEQGGLVEHIWVQIIDIKKGDFIGLIANEPVNATRYKMGQKVVVKRSKISDWMVKGDGYIYGGYTARYALKSAPDDQRKQYEALWRD